MVLPLLSRLGLREYLSICFTLCAFLLEGALRLLFSILLPFTPRFVEEWLRTAVALILHAKPGSDKPRKNDRDSFMSILGYWGYPHDTYIAPTKDGYLLGLHRIPFGKTTSSRDAKSKPVVLLWHGFMMNSEVWVCSNDRERILPFALADLGYDVWMGNTRGNKYSYKHVSRKPDSVEFWDFSIDEFALYDLPAAIDHILEVTGAPSLTYIGFSQATAQCFGALSLYNDLNRKINLFIALAPATRPKDIRNGTIQAFIKSSPNVIYLFLGRKRALSATLFWQSVLPRTAYVRVIDACVNFLFGWGDGRMSFEDRATCYRHLYSFTSVKNVVHWFQILRTGFAMYNEMSPVLPTGVGGKMGHVAQPFPVRHISTPIAILYGGADTLVDVDMLLSDLPEPVFLKEVPDYEHLSFLWGQGVDKLVFPDIIELIAKYQVLTPVRK